MSLLNHANIGVLVAAFGAPAGNFIGLLYHVHSLLAAGSPSDMSLFVFMDVLPSYVLRFVLGFEKVAINNL